MRGSPSVHSYPVETARGQTDGRIQWRPRVKSVREREGNGKATAEASADLKRPGDVEEGLRCCRCCSSDILPSGSSPLSFHLSWVFPSILSSLLVLHLYPFLPSGSPPSCPAGCTGAASHDGDNGCCVSQIDPVSVCLLEG